MRLSVCSELVSIELERDVGGERDHRCSRDEDGMRDGVVALGESLWLGGVAEARPVFGTTGV